MQARQLAIVVVASLLLASPAFAGEPTAADSETALQLYKDGKALREQGDPQAALAKLRAAYALVQTPITALELGRAQIAVGQLVEAREVLLGVPRLAVRPNESAKAGEARVVAEALAAELRPRLASLTVRLKGTPSSPPKISVDGVVVPADAATVPRVVNPGAHVVVLDVNGRRVEAEVTLAEGQSRDVEIEVPAQDAIAAVPVVPPPVTPPPTEPDQKRMSPFVYVGFGTAIVGVTVGTITGILTLSKAGSLKDACRSTHCPATSKSDLDAASATGTISTIGFAVGAAGLAVGIVALVLGGKSEPAPRSGLRLAPSANGVSGSF